MVKKTRELEMQHMDELKVLQDSEWETCTAETGRPKIPADWVQIKKGDQAQLQEQVGLSRDAPAVND